jgi:hypothetical protein
MPFSPVAFSYYLGTKRDDGEDKEDKIEKKKKT